MNRLKESERIMVQNAKNRQWMKSVKPSIDVKRQLSDFKKSKLMRTALKKPLHKHYVKDITANANHNSTS